MNKKTPEHLWFFLVADAPLVLELVSMVIVFCSVCVRSTFLFLFFFLFFFFFVFSFFSGMLWTQLICFPPQNRPVATSHRNESAHLTGTTPPSGGTKELRWITYRYLIFRNNRKNQEFQRIHPTLMMNWSPTPGIRMASLVSSFSKPIESDKCTPQAFRHLCFVF